MIVITTPTGDIGHQVLERVLADGDQPVRVVVRDPARLADGVRERVEVVTGSHGDPAVLEQALDGARAVFWLCPPAPGIGSHERYVDFTRPFAAAIPRFGVRQVVDITGLGRGTAVEGRAGYVTASLAMDDLIASSGTALRSLALPGFMENFLRQVGPIRDQGVVYDVLSPGLRTPGIATRDVAAVAARLLLDGAWTGAGEVPLLGPEDLSYDERAAVVSDVLGKTVKYQQVPIPAFHDQLTGRGMSQEAADGLVEMMIAKEDGLDLGVTRTPQHALDTPTTFRTWCEEVLRPAVEAG